MSTSTIYAGFAAFALGLSLVAICLSWFALWRLRRAESTPQVVARISSLEVDQADQADALAKLARLMKRINSREAVRRSREKKKANSEADEETDEQWKERVNRELTLGRR